MRTALLMVAFALVGCEQRGAYQKPTEPEPKAKAKPDTKGLQAYVPPPIQKKPVDKTFQEAWDEALALSDQMDREEPAATEQRKQVLTRKEIDYAATLMNDPQSAPAPLIRMGFVAWVAKRSRAVARNDPQFKSMMRIIWDSETGSRGLLSAMNVWGMFHPDERGEAHAAVSHHVATKNLTEPSRTIITGLGGEKWLRR